MDQEENHANDHKAVCQVEHRREKGYADIINDIPMPKTVDEVADTAAHNKDAGSPGKEAVLLIKNHGGQHHHHANRCDNGEDQGVVPEQAESCPGIFHIPEFQQAGNHSHGAVRLQIGHRQVFDGLIPRHKQEYQDQRKNKQ